MMITKLFLGAVVIGAVATTGGVSAAEVDCTSVDYIFPTDLSDRFVSFGSGQSGCEAIKGSMGAELEDDTDANEREEEYSDGPLPTAFDWRNELFNNPADPDGPNTTCVAAVRDQGQCGSCWAFSSAAGLAQRFCIATEGDVRVVLAPQYQLYCNDDEDCSVGGGRCQMGCDGGYQDIQMEFLKSEGVGSDSCTSYQEEDFNDAACPASCDSAAQTQNIYQAYDYYTLSNVEKIQRDLIQYGPLQLAYIVYEDHLSYDGGVYIQESEKSYGGHAVSLVGWGVDGETDYWTIQNSWGSSWGESGYFRIRRGTDEAGIESYAFAARPAAEGVDYDEEDSKSTASTLQNHFAAVLISGAALLVTSSLL